MPAFLVLIIIMHAALLMAGRCTASKNASYLVVEYMQLDNVKHIPYFSHAEGTWLVS